MQTKNAKIENRYNSAPRCHLGNVMVEYIILYDFCSI